MNWTAFISAIFVTRAASQNMAPPYCSDSEVSGFIANQTYRRIFDDCVGTTSITECVKGTFGDETVSADCALCWNQLVVGIRALPPNHLAACVSDPTSTTCVHGDALHKELVSFETCSGMNPIDYDVDAAASSNRGIDTATARFSLIFVFTILFITFLKL